MTAFVVSREGAPGREREIELLAQQHTEGCRLATSRIAVVSGPPAIGKSALMAALRRELSSHGTRVFEGHARRRSARAYDLFSSLALDLLALAEEQGTPARALGELSRRLAPLTGRPASLPAPEQARLELADALAELLMLALDAGAAVLLHDVDAADGDSAHLLRYLVDALQSPGTRSGGLLVLSHRDGPLPETIASSLTRARGTKLALGGLDVDGVRTFLGRKEVAERLFDLTSGEPGRLEEMLGSQPPPDLAARRLEKLDEGGRQLLLAAAVLGEPRPASIFVRMLGPEASEQLDRLTQGRFLTLSVEKGQPLFTLARDSDRTALLSSGRQQVSGLHAAAGEALAASGAPSEEVARHFLAGDPAGRGAEWALKAASALAGRCAHEDAVELYRAALSIRGGDCALHLELAASLRAVGDSLGALRHLGLARAGASARQMRILRAETASLCVQIGKLKQAEKLCSQALCGATDLEGADEASLRAYVDLCEVRLLRGEYPGVCEACERGLAGSDLPAGTVLSLRNILGKAHLALGSYDAARAAFEANEAQALRLSLPRELMLARINVGVVAHRLGDRRTALARYRAALEVSPQDRALAALAAGNLGALHHEAGEVHLAAEQYAVALAASTRARRPKGVSHWAANSARLALFLGESERGLALSEHALDVGREIGDPYLTAQATLVKGEALEARGEFTAAAGELRTALDAFQALGNPRYTAESGISLCRVLLAKGDVAGATAALARVEEGEAPRSSAAVAAEVALQAAELALCAGQVAEAGKQAEKARSILMAGPGGVGGDTDLEGPFRTYRILSRVRAAQGDVSGASVELMRAVRLLEDLAQRVPDGSRQRFLSVPHRAEALAASAEREITPDRARRARALEEDLVVDMPTLVGTAPALQKLTRLIAPVGRSMATVLIRGESGTGKELVAEAIHRHSPRRDQTLVKVNCAAMHEELLLSELFGHEKGAFTGAVKERKGRFELADGGTIFLDEIGDVSPKAQVALLRVLQERELERVGGSRTLPVDVRVICATNRNLEQMIAEGKFRQDLYYRLKGVMLELPPLRERREDVPALATHFLAKVARDRGDAPRRFSQEALELLSFYAWPGNVRELENVVGAVSIFAPGDVVGMDAFELHGEFLQAARGMPGSLPSSAPDGEIDFYVLAKERGIGLKELRHQLELQMIGRALIEARGNISEAARLLQMKRSRLSQIVNAEPSMRAIARGSAA